MSDSSRSSSPDASPQPKKRWTTQQIFVLFSPADGDEWYRAKDVDAAPPLRSDGGAPQEAKLRQEETKHCCRVYPACDCP